MPKRSYLEGRRIINRLVVAQALSFSLLILFMWFDDEYLLPKLFSHVSLSPKILAGAVDSLWVAGLFAMVLAIEASHVRKIKLLEGMLCVCANCKKIRDEADQWKPIEEYIQKRTYADFSHAICPDCGVKLYGDLYLKAMQSGETAS